MNTLPRSTRTEDLGMVDRLCSRKNTKFNNPAQVCQHKCRQLATNCDFRSGGDPLIDPSRQTLPMCGQSARMPFQRGQNLNRTGGNASFSEDWIWVQFHGWRSMSPLLFIVSTVDWSAFDSETPILRHRPAKSPKTCLSKFHSAPTQLLRRVISPPQYIFENSSNG